MTEPTVDTIEAIVRSIEAREATVPPGSIPATPPRSLVVAAGPSIERRAAAAPVATSPVTWVDRRPAHRPATPMPTPAGAGQSVGRLTGRLVGRAEWDRLVASEVERSRRYGRHGTIVLVEVAPRDRRDPVVDPVALRHAMTPCGTALLGVTRAADRVAVLGDRHLGVLLREADGDAADRFATRAIAACDPWLAAATRPMRLVVASTPIRAGVDIAAAIREAERRLRAPGSVGGRTV